MSVFRVSKNAKDFLYSSLLGGGHLRPLREKGGTGKHLGGIWDTSERHLGDIWDASRHLGGIWEASRRQGARGGPVEAGIEKVDRCLQPNAQVPFMFQFDEAFLRVGITNYQFAQRIMMPGSRERIPRSFKDPTTTPPGPLRGKLCLGKIVARNPQDPKIDIC